MGPGRKSWTFLLNNCHFVATMDRLKSTIRLKKSAIGARISPKINGFYSALCKFNPLLFTDFV